MKCETCKFWEKDSESSTYDCVVGPCHRLPPSRHDDRHTVSFFPMTVNTDWCGEYKFEGISREDIKEEVIQKFLEARTELQESLNLVKSLKRTREAGTEPQQSSEPHQVTAPESEESYYRRLQSAEGKLHKAMNALSCIVLESSRTDSSAGAKYTAAVKRAREALIEIRGYS